MFEFHGWAVLEVATDDFNMELEREILETIRRRIESDVDDLRGAGVSEGNGITTVWFHGQYNHPHPDGPGPVAFLRFIGEQAPGSYGLLYVRDDDDEDEHLNEYRVWRLARGKVREFPDPFLSPCVPTIEDEEKRFTPPE